MGLRAALRQDPDVIVVGDIHDRRHGHAIKAAETGTLVVGAIPAPDVAATVSLALRDAADQRAGDRSAPVRRDPHRGGRPAAVARGRAAAAGPRRGDPGLDAGGSRSAPGRRAGRGASVPDGQGVGQVGDADLRAAPHPARRGRHHHHRNGQGRLQRSRRPPGRDGAEMFGPGSRCLVVVGSQWGDEGKGKLVDVLAEQADIVVRYQGGANAGHTVVIGESQFILRQIPSGILHPRTVCVLGNGVVLDPDGLFRSSTPSWSAGSVPGAGRFGPGPPGPPVPQAPRRRARAAAQDRNHRAWDRARLRGQMGGGASGPASWAIPRSPPAGAGGGGMGQPAPSARSACRSGHPMRITSGS